MKNFIDRLEEEYVKNWYIKNKDPGILSNIASYAEQKGYFLDSKSGLFFREPYRKGVIQQLGYTVLDIIFPRPVDLHYHEDIGEAMMVVEGRGFLYLPGLKDKEKSELEIGKSVFIPKLAKHSFSPIKGGFLEIRLNCTGIFNPEKEVCVERFDKIEMWKNYHNLFKSPMSK